MDEVGTATLSTEGDGQVVHLPEGLRLPGRELHVTTHAGRQRHLLRSMICLDTDPIVAVLNGT